MKIVFLAPFGIRPKGTVIARMLPLAVELQRLGHSVVIIAPPYTNPEDSGKDEMVDGVLLKNVRLGPRHKALAAPFLAWRMFRAAVAEKPDLVHLFKPKGYGGLAAMALLWLRNLGCRVAPLFLDTDDWEGRGGMNELQPYSSMEKRFYRFQEQWLLRRAAGVTVASRGLERMVDDMGVAAGRRFYLPNCVREAPPGNGAMVRSRFGIGADTPVVLLYTRFFEFDQLKLHNLFEAIHRAIPSARFLVVGKGRNNEEDLLLKAAGERGFADALVMSGWIEPDQLRHYLAAGDVAIYPFADTLVNRCKCPAKLTELLLAGCPVVGDRVGQLAEYIRSGISGILCDPDNGEEMATQVLTLLNNRELRREIGAAGRQYLLREFAWPLYARELDRFYLTICTRFPRLRGNDA
jgi:glycosyltransferase involved in cell wall biosynthesis